MKYLLYTLILWAYCILALQSCKEPTLTPNKYSEYPIDLKVERINDHHFKYTWTATPTSDFVRYVLLISTDSIPKLNSIQELSFFNNIGILASITESRTTQFNDSINPIAGTHFVKVVAVIGDRVITSINVKIAGSNNIKSFVGNFEDAILSEKYRTILCTDKNLGLVKLYNLDSNKIIKEQFITQAGLPTIAPINDYEFIMANSFNLFFLRTSDAVVQSSIFLPSPKNSIVKNLYGDWFVVSDAFGILNRHSSGFDGFSLFFGNSFSPKPFKLYKTDNSTNQFYCFKTSNNAIDIRVMLFKEGGSFEIKDQIILPIKNMPNNSPFIVNANNTRIIFDEDGRVLDINLRSVLYKLIDKLPDNRGVGYQEFTVSTDKRLFFALRKANDKFIDVFDAIDYTYLKTIPFNSNPIRMFYFENKLILIGNSFTNSDRFLIETIQL